MRKMASVRVSLMSRWPRIVLALVVGTIGNIGVAWAGSYFAERQASFRPLGFNPALMTKRLSHAAHMGGTSFSGGADADWAQPLLELAQRMQPPPSEPMEMSLMTWGHEQNATATRTTTRYEAGPFPPSPLPLMQGTFPAREQNVLVHQIHAGFPMRSFEALVIEDLPQGPGKAARPSIVEGDLGGRFAGPKQFGTSWPTGLGFALPIQPMWGGLLFNLLFYVGFLLTARVLWIRALSRWRNRRGFCSGCGYDLSSLTRCPECGIDRPLP